MKVSECRAPGAQSRLEESESRAVSSWTASPIAPTRWCSNA